MSLINNLIAYWAHEGNSRDSAGINHGTDANMAYSSAGGKIGQGGVFNGSSSGIKITTLPAFTSFSVSGWVNFTNNKAMYSIFDRLPAGQGFRLWGGTTWSGLLLTCNGTNSAHTWTPTTGVWYHLVLTYDSGTMRLYIDGTLVKTMTGLTFTDDSSRQFQIGYRESGLICFDGKIDEVGIWSRALTQDEITKLYNSGNGLSYPFGEKGGFFNFF